MKDTLLPLRTVGNYNSSNSLETCEVEQAFLRCRRVVAEWLMEGAQKKGSDPHPDFAQVEVTQDRASLDIIQIVLALVEAL